MDHKHKLVLEGLFGPVFNSDNEKLIDDKHLADFNKCITLKYRTS